MYIYHNYISFILRSLAGLLVCYITSKFNDEIIYIYTGAAIIFIILTFVIFKLFNLLIELII